MYYRNAAAAIVVYDITNEASFDILQEWIKELNRLGPPDIVLAIAGNKCDLEDKREVSWVDQPKALIIESCSSDGLCFLQKLNIASIARQNCNMCPLDCNYVWLELC